MCAGPGSFGGRVAVRRALSGVHYALYEDGILMRGAPYRSVFGVLTRGSVLPTLLVR